MLVKQAVSLSCANEQAEERGFIDSQSKIFANFGKNMI